MYQAQGQCTTLALEFPRNVQPGNAAKHDKITIVYAIKPPIDYNRVHVYSTLCIFQICNIERDRITYTGRYDASHEMLAIFA